MTTSLEDRIRDAFARQAEQTTVDNDAEFARRLPSVSTDLPERRRAWVRASLAAAAVILLISAVAVTQRVRSGAIANDAPPLMPGTTAADVAPSIVSVPDVSETAPFTGSPSADSGLPFEVSPLELPPGWEYLDIREWPQSRRAIEGREEFLFRNATTGAAISLRIVGNAKVAQEYQDDRQTFAGQDQSDLTVAGKEVSMVVVGVDAPTRSDIWQSVTLDSAGNPSIPSRFGFVLEWSRNEASQPVGDCAGALISFATPTGSAVLNLDSCDPTNETLNRFGIPSIVNGVTVYSDGVSVTTGPVDGQVASGITVTDLRDLAGAMQVLSSLRRDGAPSWDSIADGIAAKYSGLETISRVELDDVVVTEHRGSAVRAFCATRHEVTRCRAMEAASEYAESGRTDEGVFDVPLVVDGVWIEVVQLRGQNLQYDVRTGPGPDVATRVPQPTIDGVNYVYVIPSAQEISLAAKGVGEEPIGWSATYTRPIR